MAKKQGKEPRDAVSIRLDAIIRLLIESKRDEISKAEAVRVLNSAGLAPIEIARIFGKNSATSVASYLYGKRKQRITHDKNRSKDLE